MTGDTVSLCHMSLADAFLTQITRDVQKNIANQKKIDSGLGIEVVPVYGDKQSFIENYLQHLYLRKQGIFCKQRSFANKKPDLFVYDCERSCLSKGASTGDPTKTRANGCRAYISFCFEEGATITVCILRYRLDHTGHNPANREECKVNRIDSSLKSNIQEWIHKNNQLDEILMKIAKWNKTKGNIDYKDRKYFPSPQDIQQLIWSSQKSKMPLQNSFAIGKTQKRQELGVPILDSLSTLLKTKYRDMCLFYQTSSYNGANSKPMVLVLQTQHQKEVFRLHGEKLLFISKNFEGLRSYGSAVYAFVVKDEDDVAFPIAFALATVDEHSAFLLALRKFQAANKHINPKALFIDSALVATTDSILNIFPSAKIFIPRYQVIKAVHEWLSLSAVAEKGHKDVREVLLKYVLDLSSCATEASFHAGTLELDQKVDYPEFTAMLKTNWLWCGAQWCRFGRERVFAATHTSFMLERLFLNLEHQVLKGFQTLSKPEHLVEHIAKDLNLSRPSGGDQEGLIDMDDFLEGTPEEQAENLMQEGWGALVKWPRPLEASVPLEGVSASGALQGVSAANTDRCVSAKLVTMECECPFAPFRGLCVHLSLTLMLAARGQGGGQESVEIARRRLAMEALRNGDFVFEEGVAVTTFHSGGIACVTSLVDFTCTCKASFFSCECVGVILARKVTSKGDDDEGEAPRQVVEEYTVVSDAAESEDILVTGLASDDAVTEEMTPVLEDDRSSQQLIEHLFVWSQSEQFEDSASLRACIHRALSLSGANAVDATKRPPASPPSPVAAIKRRRRSSTRELPKQMVTRESPRKSTRTKAIIHYK